MNFNKYLPVDSTEWELSKENVQPIKQGRKIPNLISALAPNGEDAWWKLQKEKQYVVLKLSHCFGCDL